MASCEFIAQQQLFIGCVQKNHAYIYIYILKILQELRIIDRSRCQSDIAVARIRLGVDNFSQ